MLESSSFLLAFLFGLLFGGVLESMAEEIEDQAIKFRQESIKEETLAVDFPLPYIPWSELHDSLHDHASLEFGYSTRNELEESEDSLAACFGHDERFGGRLKSFVEYLTSIAGRSEQIIIVSRQSARLHELWLEHQAVIDEQSIRSEVEFIESSLSEGFTVNGLHLISDSEVFGWERPQPRTRQRRWSRGHNCRCGRHWNRRNGRNRRSNRSCGDYGAVVAVTGEEETAISK
jgi:transcription-repair coupling factor (superfamily II helicase)